jgi:MOSC domain-containing protein YiiM
MEQMRLLSINAGSADKLQQGRHEIRTGIDKHAARGPVPVTISGVEGDVIVDTEHHGGPDQAVYVYGADDYVWWSQTLGRELRYGMFGENLTVAEFPADMNAGDRLLIGDVILEATAPRIPCGTLAAQMQDPDFGLRFRDAERPGVYFRVLNAGELEAGDPVTLVENPGPSVSMLELFRAWYELRPDTDLLQRIIAAPVAERARERFRRKLAGSIAGA